MNEQINKGERRDESAVQDSTWFVKYCPLLEMARNFQVVKVKATVIKVTYLGFDMITLTLFPTQSTD